MVDWSQITVSSTPTQRQPQNQPTVLYGEASLNPPSSPSVADISSNVLWPGSEELLQNILSIDPAVWQQPVALAPSTFGIADSVTYNASPSDSSTIADNGRQAVQSLSGLLSDTVYRVTEPVTLTGLTSRFLDGSLHMFCEYILPMFPIFHRPTLHFQECSPPLLLNAIALGALFLGTPDAVGKVCMSLNPFGRVYESNIDSLGGCSVATGSHDSDNIMAFDDST